MFYERVTIPTNRYENVVRVLKSEFGCSQHETEDSLILNNEKMSLHARIARITDGNYRLILDYPQELKNKLQEYLGVELQGKRRLPTLQELSDELLALKASSNLTKKGLQERFRLNDSEMEELIEDFEASAGKKRAPFKIKNAWETYQKLASE